MKIKFEVEINDDANTLSNSEKDSVLRLMKENLASALLEYDVYIESSDEEYLQREETQEKLFNLYQNNKTKIKGEISND